MTARIRYPLAVCALLLFFLAAGGQCTPPRFDRCDQYWGKLPQPTPHFAQRLLFAVHLYEPSSPS